MYVEANTCHVRLISYQAFFIQDTDWGKPKEGRIDLRYFQHKFVISLKHNQVFSIWSRRQQETREIALLFTRDFPYTG